MAFTEFYCQSGGSNMNAGTTTSDAHFAQFVGGSWSTVTNAYTAPSGNPITSGIAIDDFVHIYTDGTTTPGVIAKVTNVTSTQVFVSGSARGGTPPVTATGTVSLRAGGAWKGPNGTDAFPFQFASANMKDATGNIPRINLKNNAAYNITAAIANTANVGPYIFEGYTNTPGDGGRAILDGGTTGASYVLLSLSGNGGVEVNIRNLWFRNNGATGNATGASLLGRAETFRCVATGMRGWGMAATHAVECEAYANNLSNSANLGGFSSGYYKRCIAAYNVGSNNNGWSTTGNTTVLDNCIAYSNGLHGAHFINTGGTNNRINNCDFYNNGGSGLNITGSSERCYVESTNFLKNGGNGITVSHTGVGMVIARTCGFGSGTMANAAGDFGGTRLLAFEQNGSIIYAANSSPWNDPDNGDFRISLAAAKGTGRGLFTQTQTGQAGTVSYPDIGAAQHMETPAIQTYRM